MTEIIGSKNDKAREHFRTALENIQNGLNQLWSRSIVGAPDTPVQLITSFDLTSDTQQVMILWGCGHSVKVMTKPGQLHEIDGIIDGLELEGCTACVNATPAEKLVGVGGVC